MNDRTELSFLGGVKKIKLEEWKLKLHLKQYYDCYVRYIIFLPWSHARRWWYKNLKPKYFRLNSVQTFEMF